MNEVVVKSVKQNQKMLDVIGEGGEVVATTPLYSFQIANDRFDIDGVIYNVAHFTPSERERLDRMTRSSSVSAQSDKAAETATETLHAWGNGLHFLGILWVLAGVIGGLALSLTTETEYGSNNEYVNVGLGLSLAGASLVGGALLATFGIFAMAYAENNRK